MAEKKRNRSWIWLPLIAVVLLAAVAAITAFVGKERQPFVIKIDDELSLQFVGIASEKSPVDLRTWQERMYNDLPEFLKKNVVARLWRPATTRSSSVTADYGDINVLFAPVLTRSQESQSRTPARDVVERKLRENSHFLQLKYGNLRSWPLRLDLALISGGGKGQLKLYGAVFDNIPQTQRRFELEVLKDQKLGERQLIAALPLENPLYQKLTPLSQAEPLPATKTIDGVSVTLNQLLYNVDLNSEGTVLRGAKPPWAEGKFEREKPDPGMTAYSMLVFTTRADNGESGWGVTEFTLRYSNATIPYFLQPERHPSEWHSSNGFMQKFTLKENLGVVGQPLMVTAVLAKLSNFSAAELQTVEIAIPTTGTSATPLSAVVNGSAVTILVSNRDTNSRWGSLYGNDALVVNLQTPNKLLDLVEATVRAGDKPSASLSSQRVHDVHGYSHGGRIIKYHVPIRPSVDAIASVDVSRYSTLTLTLVNPYRTKKTVEFVAMPTEPSTISK